MLSNSLQRIDWNAILEQQAENTDIHLLKICQKKKKRFFQLGSNLVVRGFISKIELMFVPWSNEE